MRQHECFVVKHIAVDAFPASAVASSEVASLAHEVGYDAVKAAALVAKTKLARTQRTKVFYQQRK